MSLPGRAESNDTHSLLVVGRYLNEATFQIRYHSQSVGFGIKLWPGKKALQCYSPAVGHEIRFDEVGAQKQ